MEPAGWRHSLDPSENGIDSLLNQIFASEADAVMNGTENPLRAFFLASPSRAILIITVSPLCADFNSLLRIVEDLIAAYGGSKDSGRGNASPSIPSFLNGKMSCWPQKKQARPWKFWERLKTLLP